MKEKKKLVPLSQLLTDECLGDIAKYANCIYIDAIGIGKALDEQPKKDKK